MQMVAQMVTQILAQPWMLVAVLQADTQVVVVGKQTVQVRVLVAVIRGAAQACSQVVQSEARVQVLVVKALELRGMMASMMVKNRSCVSTIRTRGGCICGNCGIAVE